MRELSNHHDQGRGQGATAIIEFFSVMHTSKNFEGARGACVRRRGAPVHQWLLWHNGTMASPSLDIWPASHTLCTIVTYCICMHHKSVHCWCRQRTRHSSPRLAGRTCSMVAEWRNLSVEGALSRWPVLTASTSLSSSKQWSVRLDRVITSILSHWTERVVNEIALW